MTEQPTDRPADDGAVDELGDTPVTPATEVRRPVPRWVLPVLGTGIVAFVACTNIGNAVWASWVNTNPLGLLALNSSIRYLLATSVNTDPLPFVAIGSLRLLAPDPLFYALGFLYRERALRWSRRAYPGFERIVDQFEQDHTVVKTMLYPLLLIMPNNPVCLIAGVAAFPIGRMIVLDVVGTVGRVLLVRWVGYLLEDQIRDVLDVVAEYQRYLTIGSIALVAVYVVWQVTGNRGLAGNIDELGEDLGDD